MSSPDRVIDLRSDTVTRPTPEMRRAMAEAEVGDDVYGEDPTIGRLEQTVAGLFGRAAAVFVPSGTMGNQIAIRLLVPPAEELLLDADAHIVNYEGGGAAQHGGIQTRTLTSARGLLHPTALRAQVRPAGFHTVTTRAIAVEDTHNRGGGVPYPLERLQEIRALCDEFGVALHCDGARLWNAHVATGIALTTYGGLYQTLSVCLSKGLGAPVGSVIVGDAEPMAAARVIRRRLGGGMRQAGILAAGGIVALGNIERLADDHARARRLADTVAEVTDGVVRPDEVETNVVPIDLSNHALDAPTLAARARDEGVLIGMVAPRRARVLTHLDVDDDGVDHAAKVLAKLLA